MKRTILAASLVGLLLTLGSERLQAQSVSFGIGGGLTIPTGTFGDFAKTGWHGLGHIGYGLPSGLGLRGDFLYGQNKFDVGSGKFKLAGGLGNVLYEFQSPGGVKPYLIAGAGFFNAKADVTGGTSETKFAFGGGGGVKLKVGADANFFVEGRYVSVQTSGDNLNFIPLTAGISFGTK
jgi:opacity protein-like surface antigen